METTYLETLVLQDAAERLPHDLVARLAYLRALTDRAVDDAERNIVQRATLALRNGIHEAAHV